MASTSLSYAPDGRLFVRGAATNGGDDAVFERPIEGRSSRARAPRRPPEATDGEAGEREPEPVRPEPGGAVLRAAFARGRVTRTVRDERGGQGAALEVSAGSPPWRRHCVSVRAYTRVATAT